MNSNPQGNSEMLSFNQTNESVTPHSDNPPPNGINGSVNDTTQRNDGNNSNATEFDGQYLNSNWPETLLLDSHLYDVDFPSHIEGVGPTNNIIQSIQYQNNVSPDKKDDLDFSEFDNNSITAGGITGPGKKITKKTKEADKPKNKTRPCDHCRKRKTKCVLIPGTNNCVQCETKSIECTYVGQAIKRKPPAGSDEPLLKKSSQFNSYDNNRIVAPNVPIRDVQPVQDYSVMNNSLLKKTLSLQFPRSSFYVGPTSYIYDLNLLNTIIDSQNKHNPQSPGNGKVEQINLSDSISLRKVSEDAQFILKDDQSQQSYQVMSNDVDAIEKFVAPHGQILIDLYFRIIHPSYPILHKKVFLEKYSRTHREFSAPLLAAVYVLAIQWWDYDPSLNRFPKPNIGNILKIGLNNYLLEILKRPKLSAVQAGLLLLQCKHIVRVSKDNSDESSELNQASIINELGYSDWVLCSQVIALAEELGLGLDCTDWKLPKWERGLRKRLAWAVYIEDKWLSLKNSRPSHINEINWIVNPLIEEDFPEKHGDGDLKEGSSDIDNGKKIFTKLIELSKILGEILDSFYSMKAIAILKDDVTEILKLAKPIQLNLRNWYHQLPVELQMTTVQQRKLCSNGYLQLAYFATELTLHRKIITAIYNQTLQNKNLPKELISVCRSAARTRLLAAIDFVRDLKPEHIHSFWHSSSASNFTLIGTFASILFISSRTKEESVFFRDQIFNYRWILKISSKGFDQVGDALTQLDLVLNHIPGLLNDNSELPMLVPTVSDIPIARPDLAQSQYQSVRNLSTASNGSFISSPQSIQTSQQPRSQPQPVKRGRPPHVRMNSAISPMDSSVSTPQFKSLNSPQSSQGFSPRDLSARRVDNSPNKSKPNSPIITKSPLSNRTDTDE